MQKYKSNLQDASGRAIRNAPIRVISLGGEIATLYSDNGITPISNPVVTNEQGEFSFYAPNGRYSLQIQAEGYTSESDADVIYLYDVADEPSLDGVAEDAPLAATPAWADVPSLKTASGFADAALNAQAQALLNLIYYVWGVLLDALGLRMRNYASYADAASDSSDAGQTVFVRGRIAANDGGQGHFTKRTGVRPAANGGTILHTDDGGWLEREVDSVYKVKWFGVKGDGSDETAPLGACFAALPQNNCVVDFCNLEIHVGTISAKGLNRFTFTDRRGIEFINIRKITATNDIRSAGYPDWSTVFQFVNCADLKVDITSEFSELTDQTGMICPVEIQTTTAATGDQSGYRIRSRTKYGHAALLITRPQNELNATVMPRPMASDFVVDLYADYGNYGLCCVYNGVQVKGAIHTNRVGRSYFPVDTSDHDVTIISESHRILTDVLIKSYFANVRGITFDYIGRSDGSTNGSILCLEFQNNTQNTSITDVFGKVSSDKPAGPTHPQIVLVRQFDDAGVIQATTNSYVDNINLSLALSGTQRYDVDTVYVESQQSRRGSVFIEGKQFNNRSTKGLTFVRGDALVSASSGQFVAGAGGSLYFDLSGLYASFSTQCVLDLACSANFASGNSSAFQKWAFRVAVVTDGTVGTVSNLVKLEERLFAESNSPSITFAWINPFLLRVDVTWATSTNANSRLRGKMGVVGNAV